MTNQPWWAAEATALPQPTFQGRAPLHVILDEAIGLVGFVARYGRSETDGQGKQRPGLELADPAMRETLGEEIRSLVDAVQATHREFQQTRTSAHNSLLRARARMLIAGIRRAMLWLSDRDGVVTDAERAALSPASDSKGASHDHLAMRLATVADMAAPHREALRALASFEESMLDEAILVVETLRRIPARSRAPSEARKEARDLRDRLLTMLETRVRRVRAAARFVFQDRPEILDEVRSRYARRARVRVKKSKALDGATEGEGT